LLKKCNYKLLTGILIIVLPLLVGFTPKPWEWPFMHGVRVSEYTPAVYWPYDMVDYEEIDTREEGLEMEGRIPFLTNHAGFLRNRINSYIDEIIDLKISEARYARARTLTFDYELYFDDPVISIILKSTAASASSKTEVVSINFNVETGELFSAADVVGSEVVQLADRLLVEMIRRNPERYNPSFSGMQQDQAFSVTDEEITFWFDEFQLTHGFEGIVPLSLRLEDIREVALERDEFRIRPGFNLKMVPLRRVIEELGYTIIWNSEAGSAFIYHSGELVIILTPNVNEFIREHRFNRSLEAPPEIIEGYMYVPISFFDQILSLVAYSIDSDYNITFVSYSLFDD
jgi:hypothetical protein